MEALTAASVAALTIYDMCKAVDRGMVIEQVRWLEKLGGKSGSLQAGGASMIRVQYFARYRETLGRDDEQLSGDFVTLDDLRLHLARPWRRMGGAGRAEPDVRAQPGAVQP
jgi:hypothetical protein